MALNYCWHALVELISTWVHSICVFFHVDKEDAVSPIIKKTVLYISITDDKYIFISDLEFLFNVI